MDKTNFPKRRLGEVEELNFRIKKEKKKTDGFQTLNSLEGIQMLSSDSWHTIEGFEKSSDILKIL